MRLERIAGVDRRTFLRLSAAGLLASGGRLRADETPGPKFIVRNARPLDAESPVEAFRTWKTPNDLLFIRSHFGAPGFGLTPATIAVQGQSALALSVPDLDSLEQVTLPAVLQCSGNGRGLFTPKIPGVGWGRGAVGNAEWTGVRLCDVLQKAGIANDIRHVHLLGSDAPPNPKTPAFLRSIPIERAMNPSTLIATKMNGEPLPHLHGGPARLVVPTWSANHWIKWLRTITLSPIEAPGFYQQTGYRIPRPDLPPGVTPKPEDLVPVTEMNVKSLFANPTDGAHVKPGRQTVQGVAWTGFGRVTEVAVEIDGNGWTAAELFGPDHEGSWRQFRLTWDAIPGTHRLRARATDSNGHVQPETPAWNKSGYLWNGYDVITCEVAR